MQVLELHDGALRYAEQAKPQPGQGEILIEVHAAGVMPTELGWQPTTNTKEGGIRIDAVPSHEFSGVVAAVGEGVAGFKVGDAVYGMNDWYQNGAMAEFCLTRPEWIAGKPGTLSHVQAASVPISALTALQGLTDHGKIAAGERVLIHGGSGAVGLFAVQIAHRLGAHVITTASAKNFELLRELGADEVIDYKTQAFEQVVAPVDVVFDTVGGETLKRSWAILKPEGRMVTIASDAETENDPRVKDAFFIVELRAEELAQIAREIDSGALKTFVKAEVPFPDAAKAYSEDPANARGPGKTIVSLGRG